MSNPLDQQESQSLQADPNRVIAHLAQQLAESARQIAILTVAVQETQERNHQLLAVLSERQQASAPQDLPEKPRVTGGEPELAVNGSVPPAG